ncbi:hypothetical protein J6590_092574 [Homalodisca vitripennis]|nr:hypothetical protein J6590_092574 [Homalodisca vitripennis]
MRVCRFGGYSEEKCIVNNQYYSYLLLRKVKRAMEEKIRKFVDLREEGETNKTGVEVAAPIRTPGDEISYLNTTRTLHVPHNCAAATMDVVWRIGLQVTD